MHGVGIHCLEQPAKMVDHTVRAGVGHRAAAQRMDRCQRSALILKQPGQVGRQ
ncbi:hypothetical protein D3C87_1608010 [compost metagenome]